MQLQKLVYFAHGWAMALHKDALLKDEVQAWEFGPVIPNLYRSLAIWGAQPVSLPLVDAPNEPLEPYEEEVLEQVYEAYAQYPAATLSALTHKHGTPWEKVFEPGKRGLVIDNNLIADHFSELASGIQ
jgi:uncharacterized phage-associated protein